MSDRELVIEYHGLDRLVPYARNARTHSEAQLAEIAGSIREFGFVNPVLIAEDGTIIAGHGRVLAARLLGMRPARMSMPRRPPAIRRASCSARPSVWWRRVLHCQRG